MAYAVCSPERTPDDDSRGYVRAMRLCAKDLLWVLPLTLFAVVGTLFAADAAGRLTRGTGGQPWTQDGPPWAQGGPPDLTAGLMIAVGIVALAALAQLAARVRPGSTLVATGLLTGGYLGLGFHDGPIYLVLTVSSLVAALHAPLRTWAVAVSVALVALLVGLALRELGDGGLSVGVLWQATGSSGLTLAAGLLGGLVRNRRLAVAERAQHAATSEQLRTAQDLHDGVGHGLAVIAMRSGVALHLLERDPAAVREALEAIRDTSRESLAALRTELSRMSGQPAPRQPRPGLADLPALTQRIEGAGVRVARHGIGDRPPAGIPESVGAAAYAIAQEALTNVLRHARAGQVDLTLEVSGPTLRVMVRDDGTGGSVHHGGMGLASMRDRAAAVGGTVTAGPLPSGGFEVVADLPLEQP